MNIKNNYQQYEKLLDSEIWHFIKKVSSFYPPNASQCSIEQQRGFYDKMCEGFFNGIPQGVKVEDKFIKNKIAIRNYFCQENSKVHIIYFHGGGFVLGGLESHHDICAEICLATGFNLTSVAYRLSPEYNWPCDFEDCVAAFNYVAKNFTNKIIVMGDSAGATLAASLSSTFRKDICAQLLIYPALGGEFTKGSFAEHAHAPILSRAQVDFYMASRTGSELKKVNEMGRLPQEFFVPKCLPLYDSDFATLPPSVIFTAQCDPLCDDGINYTKKIKQAKGNISGKAHLFNEKGLVHGYLRARHCSKKAGESFAKIVQATKMLGAEKWQF